MNIREKMRLIVLMCLSTGMGCAAQESAVVTNQWLVELSTADIGTVRTIMNFEFQDSTYIAYTRKNADRSVLGFWTSSMGRLFTNDFKNGSLLHIVQGKCYVRDDSTILSGILTSAMGNYYFNGVIVNHQLIANLTDKSKNIRGTITGTSNISELPLDDYNTIYNNASDLTARRIFDPSIISGKEWKKFNKKMQKVSFGVQDDLEMVFAFFYYGSKLPFSHYALLKILKPDTNNSVDCEPQVILEEKSSNTAYMKILSFSGPVSEMDSIMTEVKTKNYQNLIVDLRDNPGGSVAAGLTFTTNIVDTSFYGGIFLTQKWFNQNQEIPKVNEYDQLPLFSEANYDLIIEGIHNKEGLCLQVIPNNLTYSGNVFILTNRNTASTCEPIVYGLKQYKQAIVVGEKTAGAMLNGEIFELASGFSLVVPTATYYTADGYKIDGNGVVPNIEIKSFNALNYVIENLIVE